MSATADHTEKLERVARVARAASLDGVLLAGHHNIAWLTAGRANRIDASRETGTARLLVAADGRRFVLANAIEMPRLIAEELVGLDYQPIEYPWTEDQEPARPGDLSGYDEPLAHAGEVGGMRDPGDGSGQAALGRPSTLG